MFSLLLSGADVLLLDVDESITVVLGLYKDVTTTKWFYMLQRVTNVRSNLS